MPQASETPLGVPEDLGPSKLPEDLGPSEADFQPEKALVPIDRPNLEARAPISKPSSPLAVGPSAAPEGEDFPPEGADNPQGLKDSLNPEPMDLDSNIAFEIVNIVRHKFFQSFATKAADLTPQTWKQALNSLEKAKWLQAIFSEFEQLVRQGTFIFLSRNQLPEGRKPITSRLVLREKKNQNNEVIKYKARLVVKGFQ